VTIPADAVDPQYSSSLYQLPPALRALPGTLGEDQRDHSSAGRMSSSVPQTHVYFTEVTAEQAGAPSAAHVKGVWRPRSASHVPFLSSDIESRIGAESVASDLGKMPPPPKLVRQGSYNPFVAIKYMFRTRLLLMLGGICVA